MKTIAHLRWWIVALIFGASVLNYIDRQTLSILAPTVQRDLGLSNDDYARIVNLFLVAYTAASLFSGRIVDRLGVRVSLALFVGWWSVANLLTSWARSFASLGACRFLLGLGEAGNWTAAPKAVAEWFPARERGLAIGLYTLGATLGATLAPVLVVQLAGWGGWQLAFAATGVAGLLWLAPWLALYRRPAEHPRLSAEERALIGGTGEATPGSADQRPGWGRWWQVMARPEIWALILGRMLTDPVWYFFQFWFAKYLHEGRGVAQQGLAQTWVVYLAADVGVLGGGWLSGRLVKRGMSPAASRVRVMLGCALLVPLAALIPLAGPLWLVLVLGMAAVLAHLAWLINLSALVVDVVPRPTLGFAFGVVATGSSLGGMLMNQGVAALVARHSYDPAFLAMVAVHPLAWLILCRLRREGGAEAPRA